MKKNALDKNLLTLDLLLFEKINFERLGLKNSNNNIKYEMEIDIAYNEDDDVYKVTLLMSAEKEEEYKIEIALAGFFTVEKDLDENLKESLLNKNTVAILMPFMRSQFSLITAQPETDSLVLPVVNVSAIMNSAERIDLEKKD